MTIKTVSKLKVGDKVVTKNKSRVPGIVKDVYPDGRIVVKWPSYGQTTLCKPSEVEKVK